MPVSPWSEASKSLVTAVFGDPEKRNDLEKLGIMREQLGLEKQKFDLDAAFNPYKINQARESARLTGVEAALKELESRAKNDFLSFENPQPAVPSMPQDLQGIPPVDDFMLGEGAPAPQGPNPFPGRPSDFAPMLEGVGAQQKSIGDIVSELTSDLPEQQPVNLVQQPAVQGGLAALLTPEVKTMIAAGYLKPENIADILVANEAAMQNLHESDPNRRMANFSAGAKNPYSVDETLAQALLSERSSSQVADLAEGKVTGNKVNIAELLNPPGQITMGPPAPGETLVPERTMADKLFNAGVQSNNPELMRMGNLMDQRDIQNNLRQQQMDDRKVETYSKETDQVAGFLPAITNFNQTLKKYPPGTDIPGLGGVDTLKPSILLSPEGRQNRQDFMAVGNGIVYLLSGKQINEAEGRRLAAQLGGTIENGTFEIKNQFTDDQMRRGVENVTRQIQSKLKNTGALLSPSALEKYKERGGSVFPDMLDETINSYGQDFVNAPSEAVQELLSDPSPEAQAEFDQEFGVGAAKRALGVQ